MQLPASRLSHLFFQIEDDNSQFSVLHHKTSQPDESKSTKSQIEFRVTKDMFHNGRLHLRCTAAISDIYRKSADIEISEDVPRIASITFESPYDHRKYQSTAPRHSLRRPYRPRGSSLSFSVARANNVSRSCERDLTIRSE